MQKKIISIITAFTMLVLCFNTVFASQQTNAAENTSDNVNGGYVMPDIYNTGYISEFSNLVSFEEKYGGTSITEPGTYEGFYMTSGMLSVSASNVTIRDFYISTDSTYGIKVNSGENIIIEDGEITGVSSCAVLGKNITVRRLYVHDVYGDLLKGQSNNVFESCYLTDAGMSPEAHADGIQISSGSNIKILGCRIDMPYLPGVNVSNAPIFVKADQGDISDITVMHNWVNGGGYPIGFTPTENYGVSDITCAYNLVGNGSHYSSTRDYSNCVEYGNAMLEGASAGSVMVKDSSGKNIKSLDEITDGSMSVSVNLANYSLTDETVTVQAVVISENGEKTVYDDDYTLGRYIPYAEYKDYTSLSTDMFVRNSLQTLEVTGLDSDLSKCAVNIRVLCDGEAIRETYVKGSEFSSASPSEIKIKALDEHVFNVGCEENVAFKALFDITVEDDENIKWYINNELQEKTGAEFNFLPDGVGEYAVCAKYADLTSDSITVRVKAIELEGGIALSNVLVMSPSYPIEGSEVTFKYTGDETVCMWQLWQTSPESKEVIKLEENVTDTFVIPVEYVVAGTYRIRARDAEQNGLVNQYDVVFAPANVTTLTLTSSGSLTQDLGKQSAVTFSCSADSIVSDSSEIKWYVNNTLNENTGADFEFTPGGSGEYTVYAKYGDVVSNSITVTVKAGFNYNDYKALSDEVLMSPAAPTENDEIMFLYTGDTEISKWQWYRNSSENKGSAYVNEASELIILPAGTLCAANYRIRAFDANGMRLCNLSFDVTAAAAASDITLSYTGELNQSSKSLSKVSFTAQKDGAKLEDSTLAWYVNDALTYTGADFDYTPAKRGSYTVYAKSGDAQSESVVITVTPVMDIVFELEVTLGCSGTTITFLIDGETATGDDFGAFALTSPSVTNKTLKGNPVYLYSGYWKEAGEYKIQAKNAAWSVVYEESFTLEEESGVNVTVLAQDGNITASVNGGSSENWSGGKTASYSVGDKISLSLEGYTDTFMYWMDVSNSYIILSYDTDYEMTVGSERNIAAVFASSENGAYVTFKNANDRILAAGYQSADIKVPENPYIAGYVFSGWFAGDEKQKFSVGDTVSGLSGNALYEAGFVKDNSEYSVTVNGDVKKYKYNDKVTVSSSEENFLYWSKDGKIVSYDKEYSFYVFADTVITAVTGTDTAEKQAVINMYEPIVTDGKIAFYSERNIPEEFEVAEAGIVISNTEGVTIENAQIKVVAKSCENYGQFTVRKANPGEGIVWYAKAYVIYSNGSEYVTQYSEEVSKSI